MKKLIALFALAAAVAMACSPADASIPPALESPSLTTPPLESPSLLTPDVQESPDLMSSPSPAS